MSCCGDELTKGDSDVAMAGKERSESDRLKRIDATVLAVAGFIAGNSTLATLVFNLSDMPADVRGYFQWGLFASTLGVAGLLAPQLVRNVKANFRRRQLSIDLLFLLGCVGAWGYSLVNLMRGSGAVYFEVFSILLTIYCLGGWVKRSTQQRVWSSLDTWSPTKHRCRVRQSDGNWISTFIANVRTGDEVQVAAGGMVPVDGEIIDGAAFVQESTITGEPHLRAVSMGDQIFAASLLVDAPVTLRAVASGRNRLIDRITSIVDAEQKSPSRWQTQADQIARFFTPAVAFVSAVTFVFWAWHGDATTAVLTSLAVLLVACPCAFGFATPVSIWVTLSRLAAKSVVVAKADVIERLASVDMVVFDKTGTLTVVQPELIELLVREDSSYTRDQLISLASSVESHSHHPIASVFLDSKAESRPARNTAAIPAIGVRGEVEVAETWRSVEVGRLDRLSRPCCDGKLLSQTSRVIEAGQQPIAIRVDGTLEGIAVIGEASIDTLDEGIERLVSLGIEVRVFSGDADDRVKRLGKFSSNGEMSPGDKVTEIQRLRSQGHRVLFVGDGVNDAAAMSKSDASIAVAEGAGIAVGTADAVWHGRDLRSVPAAIEIACRSVARLRRTLMFALAYNSIGIGIAAVGWLHPVVAVLLMLGSSLTVVLHAADTNWESELIDPPVPLKMGRNTGSLDATSSSQTPVDADVVQLGGIVQLVQ